MNITAVVLCYNEAVNIRYCLESVIGFCDLFVVDSGSDDETVDICNEYTEQIYTHPYENHASQWQWALENLPIETDWVLALDADFVVTEELKQEIALRLETLSPEIDGVYVRHRYVFGGGNIRFGGTKSYWLRIVKKSMVKSDTSDLVDFRFLVERKTTSFDSAVIEYNRHDDDISVWMNKQDKFSLRLALEEELRRRRLLSWGKPPNLFGNSDERIMWCRDKWMSLPLYVRPVIYFVYRYFLMLGFLDGKGGFLYHFLQGWWLRTVVDWKATEIKGLNLSDSDLDLFRNAVFATRDGSVQAAFQRFKNARSSFE